MRDWPDWLESLRPDDVTSARMHRSVMEAAAPLLDARREDWWAVASSWARVLIPAAAVVTIVCGSLAVRDEPAVTVAASETEPSADVVDALRSETAPAGFSEFEETDHDVVFAALGEAARLRPRPAPPLTAPVGARPGTRP